jgi:hypothetical protein
LPREQPRQATGRGYLPADRPARVPGQARGDQAADEGKAGLAGQPAASSSSSRAYKRAVAADHAGPGLVETAHRPRDGQPGLVADAAETWVCSYLSLALLAGVGLHELFGWWWADPVGALAMLSVILWQGWETLGEARGRDDEDLGVAGPDP